MEKEVKKAKSVKKKSEKNEKPLKLNGDFEGIMQTIMLAAGGRIEKVIKKKKD